MIRGILIHLDRTIWIRSDQTRSIWDLGLDLFRKYVLGVDENRLSLLLSAVVCQQVDFDRLGRSTPISSLQSINELLHTTVGAEGFEQTILLPLIKSTDLFHEDEGKRLMIEVNSETLSVGGPQGYLRHSLLRIEAEISRLNKLFKTSDETINERTQLAIVQSVERNLINRHLDNLLSKGFRQMLIDFPERESSESIRDLYKLLKHLGKESIHRLRQEFLRLIKEIGSSIVGIGKEEREKEDEEMVLNLINFNLKLNELIKNCFESDREMVYVIKEGFENFINQRQNKPAELIAKYLDQKLRQGNRSMTDVELDQCFNHVLILFRYTQGKDIFEEFYKRDLSKRLLLSKSASIDTERNMVMKLKEECGGGFTAKLETMFRDIETSTDLNTSYQTMLKRNKRSEDQMRIELNVSVLTTGSWPSHQTTETQIILPNELNGTLFKFEEFYQSKYLGRKIKWNHSLGQFIISSNFPTLDGKIRRKELSVSTYQGLILLLFNEIELNEKIGCEKIVQLTGLPIEEAVRTLQSLACGKVRVLVKTPKGKDVNLTDWFSLNPDFKHDNFKIKINQIQFKETLNERKSTTDKVVTERSTLLQLSIVRIMKSRKRMKHGELVLEIIQQLKDRFLVQPKEIKIAIESLIGRDYIERVTGSMDEYHYLA
ncbi:Cullin [Melampsora americana]|nr:Cullin [Melampsora americana]